MSRQPDTADIQAFYEFLGQRIADDPSLTPEECVQEFRAYQEELRRARSEIRESHDEYLRGEAKPLDPEVLIGRIQNKLGSSKTDV